MTPAQSSSKQSPGRAPAEPAVLEAIAGARHHNPHAVLGPHPYDGGLTLRVLRHGARTVVIEHAGGALPLDHEHAGVWVGVLDVPDAVDYRVRVSYDDGPGVVQDDPYRYLPTLGEVDLHLIGEGRHEQLWSVLGAHVRRYDGGDGAVTGTSFAVWAPNARAVSVVGDFTDWDPVRCPMRSLGSSGVWELFVPDVGDGALYKYDVLGQDGHRRSKADPLARAAQHPPETASQVTESGYAWSDGAWLDRRAKTAWHEAPMSIYEVHLDSWRRGLGYQELARELVDYVVATGFTHVELMPVMQHPFGGSWGYQVTSYFAPDSRLGSPDDLRALVDALHQAGIGVILDWVPAHFATDPWALPRFDGTALYEHPDPRRGEHREWGSYIFDYGRPQVRNFLVANALYWLEEFHADALRVDGVASMLYLDYARPAGEWLPNKYGGRENLEAVDFLQELNATCFRRVPGITTIAEESTSWPGVTRPTHLGGLGFGFKWNMGWMHDSLGYLSLEPIYRQYHHHQMTFSMMYAYTENFVLPLSHDEVVHGKGSLLGKMPGDRWQQLANLRAYFAYMWAHPGKPLVFMGGEIGQEREWSEARSLDWDLLENPSHAALQRLVTDLNATYRDNAAMWSGDSVPEGFSWIDANDSGNNVFSFVRSSPGGPVVCIANFAAIPHENYRIGLPAEGTWEEILNTDAEVYGGSGVGNLGAVAAVAEPWHARPASATLRLPPLATLWLRHRPAGSAR